jgi:hypothetical protein
LKKKVSAIGFPSNECLRFGSNLVVDLDIFAKMAGDDDKTLSGKFKAFDHISSKQ